MLPVSSIFQTRPTRPAANALMAKIQLSMDNYNEALKFSTDALAEFKLLVDFNNTNVVSTATTFPFPSYPRNPGNIVLRQATRAYIHFGFYQPHWAMWTARFYKSYDNDDLRKTIFYQFTNNTKIQFRGNYSGTLNNFAGIATNGSPLDSFGM